MAYQQHWPLTVLEAGSPGSQCQPMWCPRGLRPHDLMTPYRPHLLMSSPWGLAGNIWMLGQHNHSVYGTSICSIRKKTGNTWRHFFKSKVWAWKYLQDVLFNEGSNLQTLHSEWYYLCLKTHTKLCICVKSQDQSERRHTNSHCGPYSGGGGRKTGGGKGIFSRGLPLSPWVSNTWALDQPAWL